MPANQPLATWLNHWSAQLATTSDSARLDAEVLLKHASGLSDVDLISKSRETLDNATAANTQAFVDLRCQGQPIAYLTGRKEFYSLEFKINQQVLIPRPETELVVDCALQDIRGRSIRHILDLGTGSGAIAIAIAHNAPDVQLDAIDQNPEAVRLARDNAKRLGVDNIRIFQSDWYAGLANKRFDLIVSNPPYVDPADSHLKRGDVRFEPLSALAADDLGLADLAHIIENAACHLNPGGRLMLEHGYAQGKDVQTLLRNNGFYDVSSLQDLSKHDRVTAGRIT